MDRFDEIWRNRFQQDEIEPAPWNTPGNNVWNVIQSAVLSERNRKRRPLFFFLLFAGLALASTFAYLSLQSDPPADPAWSDQMPLLLDEGQKEATDQSLSAEILPEKNATAKATSAETADIQGTSQNFYEAEITSHPEEANPVQSEDNRRELMSSPRTTFKSELHRVPELVGSLNEFHSISTLLLDGTGLKNLRESNHFGADKNKGSLISVDAFASHSATSLLQPLDLGFVSNRDFLSIPESKALKEIAQPTLPDAQENSLRGGLRTGAAIWSTSVNSAYREDLAGFDFDFSRRDIGWFVGLELIYSIHPKFDVSAGLFFESISGSSSHNTPLEYGIPTEDQENQSHNYTVLLATPFGFAEADFQLIRKSEVDGETIELLADFESEHKVENFSFPMTLSYFPLGRNNKLTPVLSAGVGINRLSVVQNSLKRVDPGHAAFDFKSIKSSTNLTNELAQTHFDLRLGLGLRAELDKHWSAEISYSYIHGMSRIFESPPYHNKINRSWLSLGIQRKLF